MQHRLRNRTDAILTAFQAKQAQDLKRLGNDSIEEAAVENDSELASLSVIAYSLYKILTKDHFLKSRVWPRLSQGIGNSLKKCLEAALKQNEAMYTKNLNNVISEIREIDDELGHFAKNIYEKAKVKQASTAYALGLSLSQAASLTGADRKELQMYIGTTRIHDEQHATKPIHERVERLRELLNT